MIELYFALEPELIHDNSYPAARITDLSKLDDHAPHPSKDAQAADRPTRAVTAPHSMAANATTPLLVAAHNPVSGWLAGGKWGVLGTVPVIPFVGAHGFAHTMVQGRRFDETLVPAADAQGGGLQTRSMTMRESLQTLKHAYFWALFVSFFCSISAAVAVLSHAQQMWQDFNTDRWVVLCGVV